MKSCVIHTVFLPAVIVVLHLASLSNAATSKENPAAVERPGVEIKLVGTAVADQSEKSLAVVEIDGRNQTFLHEGDMVDTVLVKRILRDRVIVDAGHGEQSVKLRQSLSDGTTKRSVSIRSPTTPQVFGSRPHEDRNFQAVYLDRETAKTVFADIDGTLKDVRIDPVRVYGKPKGLRISPIEPGSVLSEIGLKTGDIVREVNGKAVTNPGEAAALIKRFKNGGEFDIKVKGRRTRQIHLIVE